MRQAQTANPELWQAIETVFHRHRKKWLKYLERFLSSPSDAEDVLHEAIWRVMVRNRSFGSEDQLRMYLGRAIANAAIELYHSRKRERLSHASIDSDSCAASCQADPQEMMERMEESERVERAIHWLQKGLGRLPPKQYQALWLTYLDPDHSSIREAGTASGIPYSTLRHRSMQGLRKLRRFLRRAMQSRGSGEASAWTGSSDQAPRPGRAN
jgi:RNA polymerase sigma factor (sigma-70 family)